MTIRRLLTTATITALSAAAIGAAAPTAAAEDTAPACAPLHLLLANGVGDTSPDVPTDIDGGFGAGIAVPAMTKANAEGKSPLLSRSYVPYKASDVQKQAVVAGQASAVNQLTELSAKCPQQKVFLVGYGSGGQIMSALARDIGAGKGPVKADQIAGVAVFADPTRAAGAAIFANKATAPGVVPGAKTGKDGAEPKVNGIRINSAAAPDGSGVAPVTTGYGSLSSRVANFCSHGDLSCDIPKDAALAKVIAGITAQTSTDTSDPLAILNSAVTAIGSSVLSTTGGFVNDHLSTSSDGKLQINTGGTTVIDRMVKASNPNSNPTDGLTTAITALTKIAGMGINAAVAVGKDVLTASTIAEVGAAMLAGPEAALGALAVKLGSAVVKLVSPANLTSLVTLAFNEISSGVINNAGLVRMALDSSYWQGSRNSGYTTTPVGVGGQTAVTLTANWVAAAAEDIAGAQAAAPKPSAPKATGPVSAAPGQQTPAASTILAGQAN
ncbi:cutinase family protein [Nocardia sp. XZ_19_231]|uniref:cutinase family protein n=1 Tax=Nocardia sp. XZ_19_231 TaxID=2769252 RepID=UPI00188F8480|nr:cutinase family protein [Nocardia sp. XZ_19_231]